MRAKQWQSELASHTVSQTEITKALQTGLIPWKGHFCQMSQQNEAWMKKMEAGIFKYTLNTNAKYVIACSSSFGD